MGDKSTKPQICGMFSGLEKYVQIPSLQLEISALLALITYSASLVNGYTYDDYLVIVKNPLLYAPDFLTALFSQRYFDVSGEATYRPVITFVYWIGSLLSGHNPFGFHLLNLVFHVLATVSVTLLAQMLGLRAWALWSGAAFAVHPMLSEAVCSIGFGEDILVALFLVLAVIGVLYFASHPGLLSANCSLVLSMFSFLLALFSKESGIALIAVLASIAWLAPVLNLNRRGILFGLYFMIPLAMFFLCIRFVVLPGNAIPAVPLNQNPLIIVSTSSHILSGYLGRLIFPLTMSVDRIVQTVSPCSWPFILSAALHFLLIAGALILYRRIPALTLGVAWFYFTIAPVSNIVPLFCQEADRYLYLPAIGIFVAVGALVESIPSRLIMLSRIVSVVLLMLIVLWIGRTFIREGDWQDNLTLWAHELRLNPGSTRAMTEIAIEANHRNKYAVAESLAREALAMDCKLALARLQLSKSLLMQQRYEEALSSYQVLLKNGGLHPHQLSQAWYDAAYIFNYVTKNPEDAIKAYMSVLAIDPYNLGAAVDLGKLYMDRGDFHSAAEVWRAALQRYPANSEVKKFLKLAEERLLESKNKS